MPTDLTLADLAARGTAPALLVPGRPPVTYADLAARAEAFAAGLPRRKGLVAIAAAPSEHAVAGYLGALAAGHAVAMLPAEDPRAFDAFADRFQPDRVLRPAGGRWRLGDGPGGPPPHPDLALVLATSGSTGRGKAVRLSRTAVAANARSIAAYLGLGPRDRAALILPLHYSYGLSVLNAQLAAGGSVWLSGLSVLDPGFLDALAGSGSTLLSGVPHSFDLLDAAGFRDADLPHLSTLTVAGGRMAPAAVRRYADLMEARGGRFFVMYGQTEATARIAYVPPALLAGREDRIGVAIPGGELSLVADGGRPVEGAGEAGELVYRGPNVMMGYAATRADLGRGAEVEALRTGDIAVRDGDGLYRIVGRTRRISKIGGVRVGHDALEEALAAEGVTAAVVGDDRGLLAAFVGPDDPARVARRLAALAGVSPRQARAERLAALPRLANGKVDYAALSARLEAPQPRDGVAEAYRRAFFPRPVRAGDSFASLGGDSLRHVELSMEIERRLGRVPADWERMTVGDLDALVPTRCGAQEIATPVVVRALAILLVVVQHATLWPIAGGSAAMMVLVGWGLARFQREALVEGDLPRFFRPLAAVLAPYFAILAGYSIAWEEVPLASLALVGNVGLADPERHTMLPFLYWFVEAYAQVLVLFAAVFAVPSVRRAAARDPFRLGMALLAGALIVRAVGPALWDVGGRRIFTLPWVLYLALFGWCAALADTAARRLAVLTAAAVVMPAVAWHGGNWIGSWVKYGLQFAVIAALLHLPRVRVPAALGGALLSVAAAGYHVYLFHRFVPELLLAPLEADLPGWLFTLASVVFGVVAGMAAFALQRLLLRAGGGVLARLRAPDGPFARASAAR